MTTESVLGTAVDRIDGPLKVTGRAVYAHEAATTTADGVAHGVIVGAAIAVGRVRAIRTAAAERVPGVVAVWTHRNAPRQPEFGDPVPPPGVTPFNRPRPMLGDDRVRHFDEPVAFVVAETFEAAREAARLVEVEYDAEPHRTDFFAHRGDSYRPAVANAGIATDSIVGEPDTAVRAAPAFVEAEYHLDTEQHAPLEPHAAFAVWDGDTLTVRHGAQTLANSRAGLAATLGLPPEKVRVLSPFTGGGFGSKLINHAETILAALAARALNRPVKVALTRQQMFANAGNRPAMAIAVKLGAAEDGRLSAFTFDATIATGTEEFCEQAAAAPRALYAAAHRATRHRLVKVDVRRGEWMRAPGEAPGLLAMESAMDELALRLGMDPVALRRVNEPERDPELGVPFSTRRLVECMDEGARRFGWQAGPPGSRARREGRTLLGSGMSAAIRPNYQRPAAARATLALDGTVTVETDMTDIGQGSTTVLAQIAAEALGVPLHTVRVALGDTRLPATPGSGGSFGAASAGHAVHDACGRLRAAILTAARSGALRDAGESEFSLAGGAVSAGSRSVPLAEVAAGMDAASRTVEGAGGPTEAYKTHSQHSYGAYFCEVAVDADTAEIRVRRMLAVFDCGRVLNPKLARSQLVGGMLWGIGQALLEGMETDPRFGAFVGSDLVHYHVVAHADVPPIEAHVLDGFDPLANPLGSKGVGELGISGAAAAVANAVFDATGVRPRAFPFTVERLLPGLST